MTLEQLFSQLTADPTPFLLYFCLIPFAALLINLISGEDAHKAPLIYVYSGLIFAVSIPGIFAIVILFSDLFKGISWRQLDIYSQILPAFSMVATYFIITRKIRLAEVPGFKRLSGLLLIIAATFVIILLVEKTHIYVMFLGSFWHLLIVFAVLFFVIKMAWERFIQK